MSALRRHDDVGDVLPALVLVAATMGALLAIVLLQHFADEGAVFCSIFMSATTSFALFAVKTMLFPFSVDMTTVLPRGMSALEMALACVNVVRRDGPICFEAVILFPRLVRVVLFVDTAAAFVMEAATGNLVGAGFLDFMRANMMKLVHRRPSHSRREWKCRRRQRLTGHYRTFRGFCTPDTAAEHRPAMRKWRRKCNR